MSQNKKMNNMTDVREKMNETIVKLENDEISIESAHKIYLFCSKIVESYQAENERELIKIKLLLETK